MNSTSTSGGTGTTTGYDSEDDDQVSYERHFFIRWPNGTLYHAKVYCSNDLHRLLKRAGAVGLVRPNLDVLVTTVDQIPTNENPVYSFLFRPQ